MADVQKAALKWLLNRKRHKALDAGRQPLIEFATSRDLELPTIGAATVGKVTCRDLAPHIFGVTAEALA